MAERSTANAEVAGSNLSSLHPLHLAAFFAARAGGEWQQRPTPASPRCWGSVKSSLLIILSLSLKEVIECDRQVVVQCVLKLELQQQEEIMKKHVLVAVAVVLLCSGVQARTMSQSEVLEAINNIQMPADWLGGGEGTLELDYAKFRDGEVEQYMVRVARGGGFVRTDKFYAGPDEMIVPLEPMVECGESSRATQIHTVVLASEGTLAFGINEPHNTWLVDSTGRFPHTEGSTGLFPDPDRNYFLTVCLGIGSIPDPGKYEVEGWDTGIKLITFHGDVYKCQLHVDGRRIIRRIEETKGYRRTFTFTWSDGGLETVVLDTSRFSGKNTKEFFQLRSVDHTAPMISTLPPEGVFVERQFSLNDRRVSAGYYKNPGWEDALSERIVHLNGQGKSNCAVVSARILAKSHGRTLEGEESLYRPDGTPASEIVRFLSGQGLDVRYVHASGVQELSAGDILCLEEEGGGHFLNVHSVDVDSIWVVDVTRSKCFYSLPVDVFGKLWAGKAIVASGSTAFAKAEDATQDVVGGGSWLPGYRCSVFIQGHTYPCEDAPECYELYIIEWDRWQCMLGGDGCPMTTYLGQATSACIYCEQDGNCYPAGGWTYEPTVACDGQIMPH